MYLLIDWGNSRLKYLVVTDVSELVDQKQSFDPEIALSPEELIKRIEHAGIKESISQVLIASVRSDDDNQQLFDELNQAHLAFFMAKTAKKACGIECAYQQPALLGIDRWLAIIAGSQTGQTVGIIDIGSAITLDIVDSKGLHLGGQIIPGGRLLKESLLNTANVKAENRFVGSIQIELGGSTSDCVNFGVEQMILGYLIQAISQSSQKYGVHHWLITGGDGEHWQKWLIKCGVLAQQANIQANIQYRPALVFQGLARLYLDCAET
jgi:type III pantothenate kinase